MAGSDQSVNLGGMLGRIGKTVGSMADSYTPVLQQATKPKGDPEDPEYLERLAQWASSNGDAQAAAMYMRQADQARNAQQDKIDLAFNQTTDNIRFGSRDLAQTGDVTNLDRNRSQLQERVLKASSNTQRANALAALESVDGLRGQALGVQTQKQAQAIDTIDAELAKGTAPPAALAALRDRKEELLKDPEVQKAANENALARWDQERQLVNMEAGRYATANTGALRTAIETGDQDEADRIIAEAPDAAKAGMEDMYSSFKDFQDKRDALDYLRGDISVPYDFDKAEELLEDIPEAYRANVDLAMARLRSLESGARVNGVIPDGVATQVKKARDAVDSAIAAASVQVGSARFQQRLSDETNTARTVTDLQAKSVRFRPSDADVERRAENMAREAGDMNQVGRGARRKEVPNTDAYLEQARADLTTEYRDGIDAEIALRTGQEVAPGAPGTTATTTDEPPTVTTQEEYDALPPGTVFIQNGQRRRKP